MNRDELIEKLISNGMLKTERIIKAFRAIDRADFVLAEYKNEAYGDYPLPIGYEQTISQPSIVAFMLELLEPKEGDNILDVGSGSGWTTTLLAEIVGPTGKVFGMELIAELVQFGQQNVAKYNFSWAEIIRAEKGSAPHSWKKSEGFDKILVSAAAEKLPQELVGQLKIGGRLVLPIQNSVWRIDKILEKELKLEEFPGFIFVPLK